MADYTLQKRKRFAVLADYDDTNGDTVTNNFGMTVTVGLTTVDGKTFDEGTSVKLNVGEKAEFVSGLGAGRKIVVLVQENESVNYTENFYV